jgi:hypothetical protein
MPKKHPFGIPPDLAATIASMQSAFPDRATLSLLGPLADTAALHGSFGLSAAQIEKLQLGFIGIDSAARHLIDMRAQIDPLFGKSLAQLQDAVGQATKLQAAFAGPIEELQAHTSWLGALGARIDDYQTLASTLEQSISRSLELAGLSGKVFDRIDPALLGSSVGIERYGHTLQAGLRAMTDSYAAITQSMQAYEPLTLPRVAFEQPPLHVFLHARSVESISTAPGGEPVAEDPADLLDKLRTDGEARLAERLQRLDSDFYRKWLGAREALASRSRDRVAHVSVSVRELFRLVLQDRAPDDAVRGWSKSPAHFDKGRPTRRARFEFIARGVNVPPLSSFLQVDFSSTLELLSLLDKGVHEKEISLTDEQLRLLTLRMDQVLYFLLELADTSKD